MKWWVYTYHYKQPHSAHPISPSLSHTRPRRSTDRIDRLLCLGGRHCWCRWFLGRRDAMSWLFCNLWMRRNGISLRRCWDRRLGLGGWGVWTWWFVVRMVVCGVVGLRCDEIDAYCINKLQELSRHIYTPTHLHTNPPIMPLFTTQGVHVHINPHYQSNPRRKCRCRCLHIPY
jgi:hypothetical protein